MSMARLRRLGTRLANGWRAQGGIPGLARKMRSTVQEEGMRAVLRKAVGLGKRALGVRPPKVTPHYYAEWRRKYDTLTPQDEQLIQQHIQGEPLPALTVLVRLGGVAAAERDATLRSLQQQLYTQWRAVITLDSVQGLPEDILSEKRFEVRVAQGAAQSGPGSAGAGPFVLLDGAVVLRPHALYLLALEAAHGAALVYADSDRLLKDGNLVEPFFKPAYSPELLRRLNYVGSCALFATGDGLEAWWRGGETLHTLFARRAQQLSPEQVAHVPQVLFHERKDTRDPQAGLEPAWLPEAMLPRASIIIPTRDGLSLLKACLESIAAKTQYPEGKLEVVVMDNGSQDPATLSYLEEESAQGRIVLVRDPAPFNYSRLNNTAARAASGELLVFLNNDVEVDDPLWLKRMAAYAMQADVGAVGGKLLYPDRSIQHGGIVLGIQGVVAHAHHHLREDDFGHHYLNVVDREMAAVTGACLAMRKSVFEEIGGFDENLAVAFNDVVLCLDALARGYRNLFVATPLMIHHESKTRGFDDTPAKVAAFREEARYARGKHPGLFARDPYYSPNLGLDQVYAIAHPPRLRKPWVLFERSRAKSLRILMLSVTHQIGHGVPVVVNEQARYLVAQGHEVIIGGPRKENEFAYEGCERVELLDAQQAAAFAITRGVDCVVMHTPPYFSTLRWLGDACATLVYDYGEPNPDFFPDADARRAVLMEKRLCLPMADRLYAISQSICDEANEPRMKSIRIANSHLTVWEPSYLQRRSTTREQMQWQDKIVVMNVCRFHKSERHYKGIDDYVALLHEFQRRYPELAQRIVFLLCGKGTEQEQAEMEAQGLTILANASDDRLIDMYAAADIYVNLSRWEGYNLGIGQALAMGLPVLASDIPAHREFGVPVSNDSSVLADQLKGLCDAAQARDGSGERQATVWYWQTPLELFAQAIEEAVASWRERADTQRPAGSRPSKRN